MIRSKKPTWEEAYRADPNNLDFVKITYNSMRNGCKDDPFTQELFMKLIELVRMVTLKIIYGSSLSR